MSHEPSDSRATAHLTVVVVAPSNGRCTMWKFDVKCTEGQYSNGDHLQAVVEWCSMPPLDLAAMMPFDERDPAFEYLNQNFLAQQQFSTCIDIRPKPLDPTRQEMLEALGVGPQPEDEAAGSQWVIDNSEQLVAIYWYANLNHGGQWSNLYSVLSTSEYSPGRMSEGPESEGEMVLEWYNKLVDAFGGEHIRDLDDHEDEFDDDAAEGCTAVHDAPNPAIYNNYVDLDTLEQGVVALAGDLNEFRRRLNETGVNDNTRSLLESIADGANGLAELAAQDTTVVMQYNTETEEDLRKDGVHPEDIEVMMVAMRVLHENTKLNVSHNIQEIIQEHRDAIHALATALRNRSLEANVSEDDEAAAHAETQSLAKAIEMLEEIVCVKEPDKGVVLLSYEGTTHIETDIAGNPGQVYDHEYFSPLGDALIALHEQLKTAKQVSTGNPEANDASQVNRYIIETTSDPPLYLKDWMDSGGGWHWSTKKELAYKFQDPTNIRDKLAKLRANGISVITTPVQE